MGLQRARDARCCGGGKRLAIGGRSSPASTSHFVGQLDPHTPQVLRARWELSIEADLRAIAAQDRRWVAELRAVDGSSGWHTTKQHVSCVVDVVAARCATYNTHDRNTRSIMYQVLPKTL